MHPAHRQANLHRAGRAFHNNLLDRRGGAPYTPRVDVCGLAIRQAQQRRLNGVWQVPLILSPEKDTCLRPLKRTSIP